MPDVPPINPCLSERSQTDLLATIAGILNNSDGVSTATQALVSVAGANVPVLPAGTYQSIFIQNTGVSPVMIRLGSGASTTGLNGEIQLAAASSVNAGNGGTVTLEAYQGEITAASAGSSSLAITY